MEQRGLLSQVEEADKLLRRGELAEARAAYQRILVDCPADMRSGLLARVARVDELGAPEEQRQARRAQETSQQALAEEAVNAGRLDDAIAIYAQIVSVRPDDQLAQERMTELLREKARLGLERRSVGTQARSVGSVDQANAASAGQQEAGPLGSALHSREQKPVEKEADRAASAWGLDLGVLPPAPEPPPAPQPPPHLAAAHPPLTPRDFVVGSGPFDVDVEEPLPPMPAPLPPEEPVALALPAAPAVPTGFEEQPEATSPHVDEPVQAAPPVEGWMAPSNTPSPVPAEPPSLGLPAMPRLLTLEAPPSKPDWPTLPPDPMELSGDDVMPMDASVPPRAMPQVDVPPSAVETPATSDGLPQDGVAMLEELLARVAAHRRAAA
jgi:hypothetical protein